MSVVHFGNPPSDWEGWGVSHIVHFHNFESLSMVQGKGVSSPSFGEGWMVDIFPCGDMKAKQGNISLFLTSGLYTRGPIHFDMAIKNSSGEDVLGAGHSCTYKFKILRWGWHNFCPRTMIKEKNLLKHGSLTVEVRIKTAHCLPFYISENPLRRNMLKLLSDEETADISFKVERPPLIDTSEACAASFGEVFSAHKLVVTTCARGSILASLCENCDGSESAPIKDVHPRVFHLLLRYIYGGDITAVEWKDHAEDLIEASDKYSLTNLKIEAEWWYVKNFKFSADNVVEAVLYADKMNCFLFKEAAIDFIVANLDEVLSSGTVEDIPKDIMHDILVSVASMNKRGQNADINYNCDDLDLDSMNDLRNELAWHGKDVDGSRTILIARLKEAKRTAG